MDPISGKPRATPPKQFTGVRRTLYSEVTVEGPYVKMRAGGTLPPVCLFTGETVDPKASRSLEMTLVIKEENRVDDQEESVSVRYFVRPNIRRWLSIRSELTQILLLVTGIGLGVGLPFILTCMEPRDGSNHDALTLAALLIALLATLWIALNAFSRKLMRKFGGSNLVLASHENGTVRISGVPLPIAQKLANYFNTSPPTP